VTALAPTLQAFFTTRLGHQRDASPHTIDSYRHAFRLLLTYAKAQTGKDPSDLDLADLDASLVSGFLDHLERERGNGVGSRNTRLAAIHSFFRFASYRHPEHAASIRQVLAIPQKRSEKSPRSFLNQAEMDALLAAPDRSTWIGRRDHVLLAVALRTGLRLSELTGLRRQDVHLGTGAHVKCLGKGRKRRDTPLDKPTVKLLRAWMHEQDGNPDDPLFPSRRGARLSPDAVQRLVAKHVATAQRRCPSLAAKRITAHTLRHSCAMDLLTNGLDVAVLALWLGHEKLESVNAYLHADLSLKERALARRPPLNAKPGRYRPNDALLAFLEAL
jgi:site-specific recombinase XerD